LVARTVGAVHVWRIVDRGGKENAQKASARTPRL